MGARKDDFTGLPTKEAALERLFSRWSPAFSAETLPLADCLGRVLAEEVNARWSLPLVRASRMDGVAVRSADFAAGLPDATGWKLGEDYVRADTGDDFDDAFDAVIAIENVELLPSGGLRFAPGTEVRPGSNVKPCGADVKAGAPLLPAGRLLRAQDLAAAAMGGHTALSVRTKPVVGFIPTGSELVPAGETPLRGQIPDSNSVLVEAMLRQMGAEPLLHPIVPDEPEKLRAAFWDMLGRCDVLLVNAGTSKGGEDYSFRLLEAGDLLFHGVAAVPGRPMSMAVVEGKPVVNLSGPPLAAFYSMDWAVRAIVSRALGIEPPRRRTVRARLREELRTPPVFSMMGCFRLVEEEGTIWAEAISGKGPRSPGAAASLTAEAAYISRPGEGPHPAGEWVELELL